MKTLTLFLNENFLDLHYSDITANDTALIRLDENNAKRIVDRHGEDGYVIISACRGLSSFGLPSERSECTQKQLDDFNKANNERTKELIAEIKSKGWSYTPVYGGFKEDKTEEVFEKSFIVYARDKKGNKVDLDELCEWARKMCVKYSQDSYLEKRPNENPKYIKQDGTVDMEFKGATKFNDFAAEYFTSLHKNLEPGQKSKFTRFTFESVYFPPVPQCYSERHSRHLSGEIF